jgi:hypothetical protein
MSRVKIVVALFSAIFFPIFVAQVTLAGPITEFQARQAVSNWLTYNDGSHFGENLGGVIGNVRLYRGGQSGDRGCLSIRKWLPTLKYPSMASLILARP